MPAIPDKETVLCTSLAARNKRMISGDKVTAIQALEPFVLYTGVRPSEEQFQQAVAFARAG